VQSKTGRGGRGAKMKEKYKKNARRDQLIARAQTVKANRRVCGGKNENLQSSPRVKKTQCKEVKGIRYTAFSSTVELRSRRRMERDVRGLVKLPTSRRQVKDDRESKSPGRPRV